MDILIEDIKHKSEITEKHTDAAIIKKADLDVKNKEINEKKAEADIILDSAIPILARAKEALNNVKSRDLTMMKALNNPPDGVKFVG